MRDLAFDEQVPVMAWSARPDMSCESLSRQWLAFTGYSAAQALGDGWSRAVHPEDLGRWLDTCVRAFDSRQPFEIEYRLRRRDGEFRWVLDRGVPRYSGDGQFLGYAGICIDIDERKRAERELRTILAGVRVLVVDGDARSRERMARVLDVAGAETRTAARSAEPLGAWRPDVVISDIGLRGGALLVKALRASVGAGARLRRPVEPLALLATVARVAHPAGA